MNTHRIFVLALLTITTGCGIGDVRRIVGTWEYTGGSAVLTCENDTEAYIPTGSVTFTIGVESDVVLDDDPCFSKFDIDSDGARARPGQTCINSLQTTTGVPYSMTYRPTQWTFNVSDDGTDGRGLPG